MTDEQVVAKFNERAPNTGEGLGFWADEIHRRWMKSSSDRMEELTLVIKRLTWAVTALTLVSVGVSAAALAIALAA